MDYFKTWPKKEKPIEDPNDLSDVAWRRRELLHATDFPATEEEMGHTAETLKSKYYEIKVNGIHGKTVYESKVIDPDNPAPLSTTIEHAKNIGERLGASGYYEQDKSVHVVQVNKEIVLSITSPCL